MAQSGKPAHFTEKEINFFESAIHVISQDVHSPIAKAICYYQLIKEIKPDFHAQAADDMTAQLQELLQGQQNFESIENLYIDIQIINDFVSSEQRVVLSQYQVIAHLQNLFLDIQNNEGTFGMQANDEGDDHQPDNEENDDNQGNGNAAAGEQQDRNDEDSDEEDSDNDDDDDDSDSDEDDDEEEDDEVPAVAPNDDLDPLQ